MENVAQPAPRGKNEKEAGQKKTGVAAVIGGVIGAMCIGATLFGLGFALGDKWGYYNNGILKDEILRLQGEKVRLADKVSLYETSKNDLTSMVEKIDNEKVVYISSGQSDVQGNSVLDRTVSYGESATYRGIIFLGFSGFNSTRNYVDGTTKTVTFADGTIDFSLATYKSEAKHFDLKPGDTIRFVLDGDTYVVLLEKLSIGHTSLDSPFPNGLKLQIQVFLIR